MKAWSIPLGMALSAWLLLSAGCIVDSWDYAAQLVDIRVTENASGQPVLGARITVEWGRYGDDKSMLAYHRHLEAGYPVALAGIRRTTDENGQATLAVHFSSSAPSSTPLPELVTGQELWVKVETELASESVVVRATPGQFALGQTFEVTVLAVGEPFLLTDDIE